MILIPLTILLFLLPGQESSDRAPAGTPRPWPSFRGLNASGVGDGQGAFIEWNAATGQNIRWKTPIPGNSNSSPIVWGDRVYVTTAISSAGNNTLRTGPNFDTRPLDDLSEHTWKLYALDASTGRIVWERDVHKGTPRTKRHPKGSQASSTPVTDGRRIVVLFGTAGQLAAYDMNGTLLWKNDLGLIDSGSSVDPPLQWGHSSSPIIYQDSVILQVDRQKDSYIAAYDLATGKEIWRTNREDEVPQWATPTIVTGGKAGDELVTNGTKVRGYDPKTGKLRWTLGPNSLITIATPVAGPDLVYVTGGYMPVRPIYAIRPGASGDISLANGAASSDAVAWSNLEGTYIPTPIVYRGLLYVLSINGVLTAYDAQTGERVYRSRVGAGGAFSASPVAADGRLYIASEDGDVFVVKAGREYVEIARNPMGEGIMATPAISGGLVIVRTLGHVFGIGAAQTPGAAALFEREADRGMCASQSPMSDPAAGSHWNGWGAGAANARFQPAERGGLIAAQVPKLKLKWAFGFPEVTQARVQPTIAGGRLFIASESGMVYSLDPKTGCTYWTFRAQAGVRTAISVGSVSGFTAYFADGRANVYALDAVSGKQLWVRKVDEHAAARITGAPVLHEGRLYVGVAGVSEETSAARPQYECCTFRGSVSALDAATGEVIWKSYTIPEEPKPRGKSSTGAPLWGPAGAGVWSAPTIDVKRSAVYVATGNGYADPPQPTSDAVIAFDLQTGKMKWARQATPNDNWILGCGQAANPNCPQTVGPDYDFSASPALITLAGGRDLIVIPQKSGMGYALDPDREGAIVWEYRWGRGSGIGGVWGSASDGELVYFAVADQRTPAPGGLHAANLETGRRVWYTPPPAPLCGGAQGCSSAQSAAVTAIPGAVFSGSADGGLRAYSSKDGSILWEFNTNREFETVNGVKANGGSIDLGGPVVAGGMLYATSGNGGLVGRPGNVLLAFGVDD